MSHDYTEFDLKNRQIIHDFLLHCDKCRDDISGSVQATLAQFLSNLRIEISRRAGDKNWVTPLDIIESQVVELRRCIIDLEAYKERLTKGVTTQ